MITLPLSQMRFAYARTVLSSVALDLRIAFRNVLRHRRRTLAAISSVAFGIVALILAAGFIEWIYWSMRETTIRSGLGHIQVVRQGYMESGQADPNAFLLPDNSPSRAAIGQMPQVEALAPRLAFSGLVSLGDATLSFIADGVSPAEEAQLASFMQFTNGSGLAADDPVGIIVGHGLAENLGAKVGDTVVLVVNTPRGGVNAVETHVRGTFSTVSKAYDDAALRIPLKTAQSLMRVSGVHVWVLSLHDTGSTQETLEQLRANYAGSRLEFIPWYELADFYNKTLNLFSKQVGVMKLIIAIIIILSISNSLTMSVLERTSEIGTSLALGTTRVQILRQFLGEGLALGLFGGVVGLILGVLLGWVISAIGIPVPPPPGIARSFVGEIRFTWRLGLDALLLAMLTTLVASLYPAWRASRLEIVDALRYSR